MDMEEDQSEILHNNNTNTVVSDEVLAHAWNVLNPEGKDKLTRADLLRYTEIFFPDISQEDLKILIKGSGITFEKLRDLVKNNPLENFDSAAEAFKVLDPNSSGCADQELLRSLLSKLPDVGPVSDLDMEVILELADADGDGKISLEDFRKLDRYVPKTDGGSGQR
uniref:EF-hand domain-containing protein n=1 Tax=Tetraselmis sp. GSL018 TaxID=582737 RepID=A0A061RAV2_9CHLO|mmetsp:Transcript_29324/g.69907  ORF Transcript_29324/g.69907 Transcript_29324/m.69907 type:complete len:166 (+) Transcript_29324:68-565(+)